MAGKLLRSILTVSIAVLLVSILVITSLLYRDFAEDQHTQLQHELSFAATATEQLGREYLEELPAGNHRLTWISSEGIVLFDSWADSQTMENHADREEIQEALETGSGSSYRYSSTFTEKTLYEATRIADGSVLRISISSTTAAALLVDMLYPIILIAVAAIAVSVWLARRMAKQVMQPLNDLDLDDPLSNHTYEELSPLLHRINSQHQEITLQMQLLKQKQQEFDQITGNMNEALVLLDAEHRILSINPAAHRLYQTESACEGKVFSSNQFDPDMAEALQAAEEQGHAEFMASVEESTYLFNISRIGSNNVMHGIVILAFDATEQAKAEQLRRDFTSNVSHELKTPLQSIIGSAELIENGIVQPQDLPRFIGHIRKEASRLLLLIEDIIRLTQLDDGYEMPLEEVSLWAIAKEAQETLSFAAAEKNVTVNVSGDKGILCGVQSLLFELIYNLVDNAIRYNTDGGSVLVSIADEPEQIRLCVADTGIGIAAEHQDKVFDRFYRVDKSHSRKSGGTGLGLSIVRHAVKYHHGTIELQSEVEKGTIVTITFQQHKSDFYHR